MLPNALNIQRRVVAARALTGLGQYDTALEMLGPDNSPDAVDARAEIVWRQKNWPAAGAIFEKLLGERYKTPGALAAVEEGRLLRAAAAYSLAGDDVALARLQERTGRRSWPARATRTRCASRSRASTTARSRRPTSAASPPTTSCSRAGSPR